MILCIRQNSPISVCVHAFSLISYLEILCVRFLQSTCTFRMFFVSSSSSSPYTCVFGCICIWFSLFRYLRMPLMCNLWIWEIALFRFNISYCINKDALSFLLAFVFIRLQRTVYGSGAFHSRCRELLFIFFLFRRYMKESQRNI